MEEGSRDPLQNAGFVVTWRNTHQDTRVTSYSIRNSVDLSPEPPTSPVPPAVSGSASTASAGSTKVPQSQNASASANANSNASPLKNRALSRILSSVAQPATERETCFAAFKALPVDPARSRRETGSFAEPASELVGATNCKEAVDTIVDMIAQACHDAGNVREGFVTEADVVR